MIRRVKSEFILKHENTTVDHLVIEANILGYPYYKYKDNYYIVRTNKNSTKLKPQLVTDEIIEV